jgi:hypothetical protein
MSSDDEIESQPSDASSDAGWDAEFACEPELVPAAPEVDISAFSGLLLDIGADPEDHAVQEDENVQAVAKATRRALDDTLFQMASEDTMQFTEEESRNLVNERAAEAHRDREKNLFLTMHIVLLIALHDSHGKRWAEALPNRKDLEAAYPQ